MEGRRARERFNQRVALHRVKGCSSGYKTREMFNQKVVILCDTYHGDNLRRWFRLLLIEHLEGLGCREFDTFSENALICQEILA